MSTPSHRRFAVQVIGAIAAARTAGRRGMHGRMRLCRRVGTAMMSVVAILALAGCEGAREEASGDEEAIVLTVCASVSDLGDLVRQVGGEAVRLSVLVEGSKDPHTVEARPGMVRQLRDADLLIVVGRGHEAGWLSDLLRLAERPELQVGGDRFLDASAAVLPESADPADDPTAMPGETEPHDEPEDRAEHSAHPEGNPHYLLDPLNGLRVAALVSAKMGAMRPQLAERFEHNYRAFHRRLAEKLIGERLADRYDAVEMARLYERGDLEGFLRSEGDLEMLGGWLGAIRPHRGARVVGDHEVWDAFARRFGLRVVGYLEPAPGVEPTTGHLTRLVRVIESEGIGMIFSCSHLPQRHARFVAERTGAELLLLADQVGERPEAADYLSLFDYNIGRIVEAGSAAGAVSRP